MGRQKQYCSAFFSRQTLAMLLALCMGSTAAHAAAVTFSHKDWDLSCDNTLTCRAAGYADEAEQQGSTVLLTRKAGSGEPVVNRVMLAHYSDAEWQEKSPPELIIAGRTAGPLSFSGDESWQMSQAQLSRFLTALKKDEAISFRENGSIYLFSAAGSSAVLLKMDDVQGRINTSGAILRKGKESESSVKLPIAAPVVTRAPVRDKNLRPMTGQEDAQIRPVLLQVLAADAEQSCTDDRLSEPWGIAQLNQQFSLVSVPCWLAAYNGGDAYFVIANRMQSAPVLVSTSASDYDNGVISSRMKGRGLGDCWSYEASVWDGTDFVESERGDTGRCALIRAGGAWDIPEHVSQVVGP
ncbi:MAG: DUF1176 domain-containing protein [Alcaligenes pakistanensis]|uniref:DUF1176 domain-containing protein n=1 Tax=Alcaligenes pakistanensis TaxID=1482717 RepID=UPI00167532B5|nr:DUF1176 domain-containing protein [Alcaligenes pakistanensis]